MAPTADEGNRPIVTSRRSELVEAPLGAASAFPPEIEPEAQPDSIKAATRAPADNRRVDIVFIGVPSSLSERSVMRTSEGLEQGTTITSITHSRLENIFFGS